MTIDLADGRQVILTQTPWRGANWHSSGYLSTENPDEETGPTVSVRWASLGAENAEDDADWANPEAITHYSLGDLL